MHSRGSPPPPALPLCSDGDVSWHPSHHATAQLSHLRRCPLTLCAYRCPLSTRYAAHLEALPALSSRALELPPGSRSVWIGTSYLYQIVSEVLCANPLRDVRLWASGDVALPCIGSDLSDGASRCMLAPPSTLPAGRRCCDGSNAAMGQRQQHFSWARSVADTSSHAGDAASTRMPSYSDSWPGGPVEYHFRNNASLVLVINYAPLQHSSLWARNMAPFLHRARPSTRLPAWVARLLPPLPPVPSPRYTGGAHCLL